VDVGRFGGADAEIGERNPLLQKAVSSGIAAERDGAMTRRFIAPAAFAVGLILALSGCTNPYDPAQRAVGGGLIGAGSGAAIGAAAGGGLGAATGAAVGGAAGAVTGVLTTPPPPPRY
jgi:hypothetical protein